MTGSIISGWGYSLPEKVLTNKDFEAMFDTSDSWIVERTGIRERHIGSSTSEMAREASTIAMGRANLTPEDVGTFILSTTTPDQRVPATSSVVHDSLKLSCGAFDLNAACAGFVYALVVGETMLQATNKTSLVVGADKLSEITDYSDRSTAILFGDAGGAVTLSPYEGTSCILSWDLGVDGSLRDILYCDYGGYMKMVGKEVFRKAVRATVASAEKVLDQAGIKPIDIAHFIPHQANIRIMDAVLERLSIPSERLVNVLDRTGNTSSASVPVALAVASDEGRLKDGDLILFSGFGAGLTWASAIVRWGKDT